MNPTVQQLPIPCTPSRTGTGPSPVKVKDVMNIEAFFSTSLWEIVKQVANAAKSRDSQLGNMITRLKPVHAQILVCLYSEPSCLILANLHKLLTGHQIYHALEHSLGSKGEGALGLVLVGSDMFDKRTRVLELTPKGREVARLLSEALDTVLAPLGHLIPNVRKEISNILHME